MEGYKSKLWLHIGHTLQKTHWTKEKQNEDCDVSRSVVHRYVHVPICSSVYSHIKLSSKRLQELKPLEV